MGGVANSEKGFLGLSKGPTVDVQNGNSALTSLNDENSIFGNTGQGATAQPLLQDYANGKISSSDVMNNASKAWGGAGWAPAAEQGLANELATGATTGSKYATEQVQNNGILGGLFGKGGQLNQAESKLTDLNNQGFELKPEDMTLYGQTSGNIARMFGQQGNQASQDLASRGLASAPSGAAGAMFSGLAGNQNEMLAKAQQQIMQQRFQDTQNQIQSQQNFIGQLGQQGANAINQQYGRQLSGAQNQKGGLEQAAGLQNQANAGANQANLGAAQFAQDNKPQNFFDMAQAGAASGMGAAGKTGGQKAGNSMFGAGATPPPV